MNTEELIRVVNANHQAVMAQATKTTEKVGELDARMLEIEQKVVSRRGGGGEAPAASWGAAVVASDEYKNFAGQMNMHGRVKIGVQSAVTTGAASAGPLIAPDRQTDVTMLPHRRLVVRDLLAPGRTGSNLVEYPRQTGYTNNAAPVAEGALKPQSDMTFELAQAPVRTVAHWIPVSRQAMSDAQQLMSLIDSELRYGLALKEEQQLLNGDGTGENLNGLVTQATDFSAPFVIDAPTMLDTLLLAVAQAQQTLLPATGIIVNDLDWAKMQSIKDGQGRYIGAGPFGRQPALAWNVAVVPTPAMAAGQFLVGAFAQAAQIFDRQDPEILIADQHDDFFVKNMLAVLCEQRLALAVKRPEGLIYGEFPAVAP